MSGIAPAPVDQDQVPWQPWDLGLVRGAVAMPDIAPVAL
jgi:hypothetical protein